MKHSADKMLDEILASINHDEDITETVDVIKDKAKLPYSVKEIHLALELIEHYEYAKSKPIKSGGVDTGHKSFYISLRGRLFIQRGGFQYESKILNRRNNWTLAKTIAATLNAISILAIAVWGVCVSKESKLKDEQIYKLESVIDSLQTQSVVAPIVVDSDTVSNQSDSINSN